MTEQELIYTMALSRVPSLNLTHQHILLETLGSATAIFEHRRDICDVLPDAHPRMAEALALMDIHIPRAEEELAFAQSGRVRCIHYNDEAYPARLRECPDAPLIIYYRGTTDLNARHILSMVGTRKITEYGKDICRQFIKELKGLCPDTVIVSVEPVKDYPNPLEVAVFENGVMTRVEKIGVITSPKIVFTVCTQNWSARKSESANSSTMPLPEATTFGTALVEPSL